MKDLSYPDQSYWRGCLKILLLCLLLVSCTTLHITYSIGDWILLWKLDDYFNLSPSQEKYLQSQIQSLHDWHRQQQLSHYIEFLNDIDRCAKDELSMAELESIFASVERFRVLLAKQVASPGAEFLATVTHFQILHLKGELDQDYRRLVSEVEKEPEGRLAKRVAATLETLTSWVGGLSVDQETYIRERMATIPDITDVRLAYRKNRQKQLVELLRESEDSVILQRGLYLWLADWKTGTTAESLLAFGEWREGIKKAVLDIDRILTPAQRIHFSRKLKELIHELKGLAG